MTPPSFAGPPADGERGFSSGHRRPSSCSGGSFAALNPYFLTARNLTNLVQQIAAMGTISAGVVLVLLLGEIDLSVGAVSGLSAAVMAVLQVQHRWGAVTAMSPGSRPVRSSDSSMDSG